MIKTLYCAILNKKGVYRLQANRTYKDSVFTRLFGNKENLIELYNAIEGTDYGEDTEIEINTLEDVLYMDRVNDISFTINGKFVILVEHQTTVNQNMPLRFLMYVARLYEKIIDNRSVYKEKLIKIPTPEFIVLYNGKDDIPEKQIMKLSDAFIEKDDIKLELKVKVININYGKSSVLQKSKNLNDYSYFIYDIQQYLKNGLELKNAIKSAIEDCIKQDILRKFLETNSSEVINMLYTAFDIDAAKEVWQEEAKQEGMKKGRQEERKELARSLLDVLDIETIAKKTGLTVEDVKALQ